MTASAGLHQLACIICNISVAGMGVGAFGGVDDTLFALPFFGLWASSAGGYPVHSTAGPGLAFGAFEAASEASKQQVSGK